MARTDPQFNLRLPEELKEFLKFMATLNGRSLNAEITNRLVSSIRHQEFDLFCDSLGPNFDSQYDQMNDIFSAMGYDSEKLEGPDLPIGFVNEILHDIYNKINSLEEKVGKKI